MPGQDHFLFYQRGQLLKDLIKKQWWTTTDTTTAKDGTAGFRGFLGEYQVTVQVPGVRPVFKRFTLGKGQNNRWTLRLP